MKMQKYSLFLKTLNKNINIITFKSDTKMVYQKYLNNFLLMNVEDKNQNMVASFAHLTSGYEAKYYSYLVRCSKQKYKNFI
jgi:Zn-dependent oligopeptidase